MLISKAAKRNILLFVAAFFLCGILHIAFWQVDFTYSFAQLSCGALTIIWAITVQKRITDKRLCRLLFLVAAALLLHFILQFLKYDLFDDNFTAGRYIDYFMSIPMILIPILCYLVAVSIYHPIKSPLPKSCYIFLGVGLLLIMGLLTNDLHSWAKTFPEGPENIELEIKGWLFYLSQAFIYGLYALSFVIVIRKNHRYVAKPYRILAFLPFSLGVLYFSLYPLKLHRLLSLPARLWNVAEMQAFLVIAILEVLILLGMIPENRSYEALFSAAPLHALIMDTGEKIVYRSGPADFSLPGEDAGEDVKILSHPINGGKVEYLVDIKELNSLNRQLAERTQEIESRNAYLSQEVSIKKEKAELETQIRLYENISHMVRPQMENIDLFLNETACEKKELAVISVLMAYIKRRSNMELLSADGLLTVSELSAAIQESLNYLKLLNVNTALSSVGSGSFPSAMIGSAYEHFQAIIEACMDSLSDIFVVVRAAQGELTLRLLMKAGSFSYEVVAGRPAEGSYVPRVLITKEHQDMLVVLSFSEGGGQK